MTSTLPISPAPNGLRQRTAVASEGKFVDRLLKNVNKAVPWIAIVAIAINLTLRFTSAPPWVIACPLIVAMVVGGPPLLIRLGKKIVHLQFGSDLLAGVSIVTAMVMGQYLAGVLIILMLSGGEWLESYAQRTASGVLEALARRMPVTAHRWMDGRLLDIELARLVPGDQILVMPHEVCPADGVVAEGQGSMDESYLTGEPYKIAKAVGSDVLSGALNGNTALTVRVSRTQADSRYTQIMQVMREAEQRRIKLQRIGDMLGAWFTPLAVLVAIAAWLISGDSLRFLAVIVAATPCPLILAIPVAIIGTISLCARHGIVIRDAAILERLETCQTIIFDKTGTLTVGQPTLAEIRTFSGFESQYVLQLAASIEQYSRHPLAPAVLAAAKSANIQLLSVEDIHEPPGFGLRARFADRMVVLTGRKHLQPEHLNILPPVATGLECIVLVDGQVAAVLCFRDEPRAEMRKFIDHLRPHHHARKLILLTGDRKQEADRIADLAGIETVIAEKSPEEKLDIVRKETAAAPTLFVGDGINDGPALLAATVGVALGAKTDVASAASGATILEPSLRKLDELVHIARRARFIVLQSAIGGMLLSLLAMGLAAAGYLAPVAGAVFQEVIDLAAILNAMRAAFTPKILSDI
jgi:heavy metal translocating P-type ATPase